MTVQENSKVKRDYARPVLLRRDKLSAVTAEPDPTSGYTPGPG